MHGNSLKRVQRALDNFDLRTPSPKYAKRDSHTDSKAWESRFRTRMPATEARLWNTQLRREKVEQHLPFYALLSMINTNFTVIFTRTCKFLYSTWYLDIRYPSLWFPFSLSNPLVNLFPPHVTSAREAQKPWSDSERLFSIARQFTQRMPNPALAFRVLINIFGQKEAALGKSFLRCNG